MAVHKKLGRKVGVEVEFNSDSGQPLDTWCSIWGGDVHEDGSCGYEAVTPPLTPSKLKPCLEALQKALATAGCDNRCGLHVHVDARDITWPDMYKVLSVYAKVEGALFVLGGQERYQNTYSSSCGPEYASALSETKDRRYRVLAVATGDTANVDFRHINKQYLRVSGIGKKHGGRYKAINIIPWIAGRFKGKDDTTIEFRLHRGTHDAERIYQWASLCSNIVSWACKATKKEIAELPRSPMRALLVMSPDSKDYIIKRLKLWREKTTTIISIARRKKSFLRKMSPLALYSGRADAVKAARAPFLNTAVAIAEKIKAAWLPATSEALSGRTTMPSSIPPLESLATLSPPGRPLNSASRARAITAMRHCGLNCGACDNYIRQFYPEDIVEDVDPLQEIPF